MLEELDAGIVLETSQQVLSICTEKRRYDEPVTIVEGSDLYRERGFDVRE